MLKSQAYLNARQESLRSWRNWGRQAIKTPDFRRTSSVCSGTRSGGSHGRPRWSSSMRMTHGRRPGWLHEECPAEPKPPGKLTEGERAGAAPRQYRSLSRQEGRESQSSAVNGQGTGVASTGTSAAKEGPNRTGTCCSTGCSTMSSGKGHKKAQAACRFCFGLYWPGTLTGLKGKGLGKVSGKWRQS